MNKKDFLIAIISGVSVALAGAWLLFVSGSMPKEDYREPIATDCRLNGHASIKYEYFPNGKLKRLECEWK